MTPFLTHALTLMYLGTCKGNTGHRTKTHKEEPCPLAEMAALLLLMVMVVMVPCDLSTTTCIFKKYVGILIRDTLSCSSVSPQHLDWPRDL